MDNQPTFTREVLNIPFGEIIREVAIGIAEAQFEMDKTSMIVAEQMSGQKILREAGTGEPILDAAGNPQVVSSMVTFGHQYNVQGKGATAVAQMSGKIVALEILDGGSGYTEEFTIDFISKDGNGSGARAQANIDEGGKIVSINLEHDLDDENNKGGTGYTSTPKIVFVDEEGNPIDNTSAKIKVRIDMSLTGVQVTNTGTGYTKVPRIKFEGGNGTGATATAMIQDDGLIFIQLTNGGSGYTSPPEVFILPEFDVKPQQLSMMELGFVPNFYQFVDTVIEMKLALRINKQDKKYKIWASSVDANYTSSYNYNLNLATTVKTKIVPIPPPTILEDRIRTMMDNNDFVEENML